MATESVTTPMPVRNPDTVARAIEAAREKLATVERQAIELRKAIRILEALESSEPEPHNPQPRADEYKGMKATLALENYLRARKGTKILLSKAAKDLVAGGTDPGADRGRKTDPAALVEQKLRIGLPYLSRIFAWEPVAQTRKGFPGVPKNVDIALWLSDTADLPRPRKRKS